MNITHAQYIAIENTNVSVDAIIDEQQLIVPLDLANRHYAEIMRQVDAGELTIADAD